MAQEGVVEDEIIAKRLWIKFKNESIFANYSPYIVCLASGTLDPKAFLSCISQDVHFLDAFLHALCLAEGCVDGEEEKIAIGRLLERGKEMLENYDVRVREWGFELPRQEISSGIVARYTEFLLAVMSGKIGGEKVPGSIETPIEGTKLAAYILAAMAPWMRLYASISKEIQGLLDTDESSHIYKKWVDDYCSKGFETFTLQIEDLLEKLSISLTGEELDVVERSYLQSMKLEVEFFTTQPVAQRSVLPLSLLQETVDSRLLMFFEFDMTCTTVSTSAILADAAIISAQKVDTCKADSQLTPTSSADLTSTWSTLAAYAEELYRCLDSTIPSEKVEKLNYGDMREVIDQVADLEKKANSRVIELGALKGVSLEDINWLGQSLPLKDGCKEFFQKIVNSEKLKSNVHVISYCWCGDLIRSAFSSGDLNVVDVLKVHSNELAYEGSVSTGEIVRRVESPVEKFQVFSNILKDCGTNGQPLTFYIGCSISDILCLLEADIGIVMGSSTILRKLGNHCGISFVPLFSGVITKQKELAAGGSPIWKGRQGTLYTVSGWAEIHAFLQGL